MAIDKLRMETLDLFPSPVFSVQDFYDNKQLLSTIEDDLKTVIKDSGKNFHQSYPDLHKRDEFKEFADRILMSSKQILSQKFGFKYDNAIIPGMWYNVQEAGNKHDLHTHSNNLLSGVYYVESDKSGGIIFQDPRQQVDVIKPLLEKNSPYNSTKCVLQSNEKCALFFPSWLKHQTQETKSRRISISWNIMITGYISNAELLQQSYYD